MRLDADDKKSIEKEKFFTKVRWSSDSKIISTRDYLEWQILLRYAFSLIGRSGFLVKPYPFDPEIDSLGSRQLPYKFSIQKHRLYKIRCEGERGSNGTKTFDDDELCIDDVLSIQIWRRYFVLLLSLLEFF